MRTLLSMCGILFASESMEVMMVVFLQIVLRREWNLSLLEATYIGSSVFLGEVIGGLFLGYLADYFGRRKTILLINWLVAGGGLLSAFANDLTTFCLLRVIVGIGVGGMSVPFDMLGEEVDQSHRIYALNSLWFFFGIGALFSVGIAWAVLDLGWQMYVFCSSIPSLILFPLSYWYMPESVEWLMTHGRTQEAEHLLRERANTAGRPLPDTFRLLAPQQKAHLELNCTHLCDNLAHLFSAKLLWTTVPLWICCFAHAFLYYSLALLTGFLFESSQKEGQFDYAAIFISSSTDIWVVVFLFFLQDLNRRLGIISSFSLTAVACIMLSLLPGTTPAYFLVPIIRFFGLMAGNLTWVYGSEVYSTDIRGFGHSLANTVSRFGALCAPIVMTFVFDAGGVSPVGLILGIVAGLAGAVSVLFTLDSRGSLTSFSKPTSHNDDESDEKVLLLDGGDF